MSSSTSNPLNPAELLAVEDNPSDLALLRAALDNVELLAVNLHEVRNGRECMDFLRKQGEYADAPTPDLILLDLNMPIMNGYKVVAELANDESLKHLPVVVLTTQKQSSSYIEWESTATSGNPSTSLNL